MIGTASVFTRYSLAGGTMSPYIKGKLKHFVYFGQDLRVGTTEYELDQDRVYGGLELGTSYVKGQWSYGASAYGEVSKDEQTAGGRLSARYRF